MFDSGQNWKLFGYDMRDLGKHFTAAWRDLLWAFDSPVRSRLDEPVSLRSEAGECIYHTGIRVDTASNRSSNISSSNGREDSSQARCSGVLLPAELVLCKVLRLPLAAESDLDAVLALEVSANSPFSASDTGHGWHVSGRDEQALHVVLVIVSLSAAMTYVGREYHSHDAQAQEVWVAVDDTMVVVKGFGEGRRERYYRKRLVRVGVFFGAAALLVLVMIATSAGFKKLELRQLESVATQTTIDASAASRMRSAVAYTNETMFAVNEVVKQYPSAHIELARLSKLLGDGTYLERFSLDGRELDLRGRAVDAAAIMKLLVEQPEYVEVAAASPIRKVRGSLQEQFHLKISIAEGAAP